MRKNIVKRMIKIRGRITSAVLMLFLVSVFNYSMPAKHTPTAVAQPDGTIFSIIGFGDEQYNFAETTDGYVVIQGADNFWYYAALSTEGRFIPGAVRVAVSAAKSGSQPMNSIPKHLRESSQVVSEKMAAHPAGIFPVIEMQKNNRSGLSKAQSSVKRILILCVKYPDQANTQTALSFQDMVNDDTWKSNTGGVSKYYQEVSNSAVSVSGVSKEWITAAQIKSYYAYNNSSYSTHVKELVKQCVDAAVANGVDFSLYDNDGDGSVDGLFIVHAGKGAEEGSDLTNIWSHAGWLDGIYTVTANGKKIDRYIIVPELYNSNHVEIGVFCHEYGHMLGLPDMYDVDGSTNGSSSGLGYWCLMAGGSWGGNGYTPERPSHMSAYCKELLGYTVPTVVASSQALSIPQAETNAFSYKVWLDNNQADEYMLIENRQKTNFDLNIPGSGLLMYHVDKNLADIWPGSNNINVTNTHLGVKLYEADGLEQLATAVNRGSDGDPYPGSTNKTSLTAATTPNSKLWNGTSSNVEINAISASSATMTANAVVPVYYGYAQQFYRKYFGYSYGNSGANTGYGMVKCIPSRSGKLVGIRIYSYASKYTALNAAAFTKLNGNNLSSQTGSTVSGASAGITNYISLNFPQAIDVTQNVPIYVRVQFTVASGGYAVPIDMSSPATTKSYYSSDGTNFTDLPTYDIPVRVVFESNTALPVELFSFTAESTVKGVELKWNTATETNNYGFDVEQRAVNDRHLQGDGHSAWTKIGFVEGNGTTNASRSYSFTDKYASGKTLYRLKQIDRDGKFEYSQTVEVTALSTPKEFALGQNYPNPFNPTTVISYQLSANGFTTLKIYDAIGREVATLVNEMKEAGTYTTQFDGARFSSGIYFAKLTSDRKTQMKKLLLLK
jgi:M6 family metalloprotease-like protein